MEFTSTMFGNESKLPIVAIVIPCFNEEPVLEVTLRQLHSIRDELVTKRRIAPDSFFYLIDDGSTDKTWQLIEKFHSENNLVKGLKLTRNAGHQRALLAGMLTIKDKVDCIISADADLQDDLSAIEKMIGQYSSGSDIVYGVRKNRETDSLFKKMSALAFYKLMSLMGVDIVYNHADYRLISSRALEALAQFNEVNLFLRGIIPLLGFKTSQVYYDRQARAAGVSKYNLKKMLAFALDGITSFSIVPLRIITVLGLLFSILSLCLGLWVFTAYLFDMTIPGWTSTVLPIYVIGGVQLLSIGLIGEYLGKIYSEVKARPRYIVERELF
jgi:glycosyltransferase involved in cell wall biosynthesis